MITVGISMIMQRHIFSYKAEGILEYYIGQTCRLSDRLNTHHLYFDKTSTSINASALQLEKMLIH